MNDPKIPDAEDLRKLVEEIAQTHVPFGMYGPAKYPPKGCPLMDVPQEYLAWFQAKGFPKGKLGCLMEQCLLLKGNGLDPLFDPFRKANGGRTKKNARRRVWDLRANNLPPGRNAFFPRHQEGGTSFTSRLVPSSSVTAST